jgi:hypothetical protein
MDYIDNYQFSPFPKSGGGIPLDFISSKENPSENVDKMLGGSRSLSHLSIPGGLFIKNHFSLDTFEKIIEEDPAKINIIENFDVFIDLVSSSIVSNKPVHSHTKKNRIKKMVKPDSFKKKN